MPYNELKVEGAKANQIADCMSGYGILPPVNTTSPHDHFRVGIASDGLITVSGRQANDALVAEMAPEEPGKSAAVAVAPGIQAVGKPAERMISRTQACIKKAVQFMQ